MRSTGSGHGAAPRMGIRSERRCEILALASRRAAAVLDSGPEGRKLDAGRRDRADITHVLDRPYSREFGVAVARGAQEWDRRQASPGISCEIFSADRALSELGDAWRRLALRVPDATFFMFPCVFRTWCEQMANEADPAVLVATRSGELIGVLPVATCTMGRGPAFAPRIDYLPADRHLAPGQRRIFRVRQLSSVVSWAAAAIRPTLLCMKEDQEEVVGAIARTIADQPGLDQILIPACSGSEADHWMKALADADFLPWVHDLRRQVLTLEHLRPFEDVVSRQNRNFRRNVRRAREVANDAGLDFSCHAGRDAVHRALPQFAELAAETWKAGNGGSKGLAIPYAGDQRRFAEAVVATLDEDVEPVIVMSELQGVPVSGCICMLHGPTVTGWLTFTTDRLQKASAGMLILEPLFAWALENGARRMDFNATQDWLRHLSDSRRGFVNVAAFTPSIRGRLFAAIRRGVGGVRRT